MSGSDHQAGVLLEALARALPSRRAGEDFRFAATLVAEACDTLHHGHELAGPDGQPLGVVHGGLSPRTVALTPEGGIQLLEFGGAAETQPRVGSIKERTAYLAPEQVRGQAIDRRTDVFALGAILFELATARNPFQRENEFLTLKAILEEPIPQPATLQPELTPAFAAAIMRALARDPNERYPSARAFGDALLDVVAPLGGPLDRTELIAQARTLLAAPPPAPPPRPSTPPTGLPPRSPTGAVPTDGARPARSRRVVYGLAAAASAVVAVGAFALFRPRPLPMPVGAEPAADPPSPTPTARDTGVATVGTAPVRPSAGAPAAPAKARRPPGFVTIQSRPLATIYVDGRKIGETPLVRAPLPAGKHTVRAVLANGREKRFAVTVRPGRAAPARRLRW